MGYWSFIQPIATTNKITNPSFETGTTSWSNSGSNTIARSSAQSKFGGYSLLCTYQDNTTLATFASLVLTAAAHYISAWVYLSSNWDGGAIRLAVANLTSVTTDSATTTTTETGKWVRLTMGITPDAGDLTGDILIQCASAPTAGRTIYVDAVQVEALSYASTYADGDQPGCSWTGTKHGSTSTRSAQYRGGGRVIDIDDTYGVKTMLMSGVGLPQYQHNTVPYALLPGSQFQSIKTMPRSFILTFTAKGTSLGNLHDKRDDLIEAFRPDKVLPVQPVRLRYTGNDSDLEIDAVYDGGLESNFGPGTFERLAARFVAYDPHFYTIGTASKALGTSLSVANADYIIQKNGATWSALSSGISGECRVLAVGPDGSAYVAGTFLNQGDANGDYIVKWDPTTSTWSSLGTGMQGGNVYALAVAPDGTLYAGGDFTTAGGVANTAYIAKWNGSAWSPLSTGTGATVYALAIGQDGNLYVGGAFTNLGDANGDYVVKWTGAAWVSLGTGMNGLVYALAIGLDGSLYATGAFTLAGGVSNTIRIAKWNGSAWSALSTGLDDNSGRALAIGPDGSLYVGGPFTLASGVTGTAYIAKWNGSVWTSLGTGMNGGVYSLTISSSGMLYAGGVFTTAGGLALADRLAAWNGSTWVHVDTDLPGTPTVYAVALSGATMYFGFDTTGTATTSETTTVTNNGSTAAYPKIVIKRSGGTSATLEWIKNETTGQTLYCNYSLLDGETLTIDLDYRQDPTKAATKSVGRKRIYSDFFGNVPRAILRGSDEAEFCLQGGDNTISLYINEAGTPTLTCYMEWKEPHVSIDTVAA